MKMITSYKVKIKHYNHILKETLAVYRAAVDFLIPVCNENWETLSLISGSNYQQTFLRNLVHKTKDNPNPEYPEFDTLFYKFPSYLLRSAVTEAIGKVSSYRSNLANWENDPKGKRPAVPKAGCSFPSLYRENMFVQTDTYEAKIKVFVRNTWDWLTVQLRKSDMDYIRRHCKERKQCAPTLMKQGKEWFLVFPFEENVALCDTSIMDRTIVSVDLGINTAATVSVMRADGTILGRHFCKLPKEIDLLNHSINLIKKAQQHGARRKPRLWARVNGINAHISAKTAQFIIDTAVLYHADVIVFEHLNLNGKKKGSMKQRLHLWRSREVQDIVTCKAHRLGMRISRICAWGTSKLAYDGSGTVKRGKDGGFQTYGLCRFQNGKIYNCDLSASYNIGARYFIREILKSLRESVRLRMEAKVPSCCKRSTCTFSTLISLYAALTA